MESCMQFRTISSQRGVYLPLLALLGVVVIAIAGFAIDSAFLYVRKQQVQNAVDSAATIGARLLLEPNQGNYTTIKVHDIARNYVRQTLKADGYDIPLSAIDVQSLPAPASVRAGVRVSTTVLHDPFFIRVIPGLERKRDVPATSSALNTRLRIVLVLDSSWSMDFATTAPTQCTNCCDTDKCRRLKTLKFASKLFVDGLKPFDSVAVVRFANRETTETWGDDADIVTTRIRPAPSHCVVPPDEVSSPHVGPPYGTCYPPAEALLPLSGFTAANGTPVNGYAEVKRAIDDIQIFGTTNIPRGLELASEILRSSPPESNEQNVIVLVTDGAPFGFKPRFRWDMAHPNTSPDCVRMPEAGVSHTTFWIAPPTGDFGSGTSSWDKPPSDTSGGTELFRRRLFMDALESARMARLGIDPANPTNAPDPKDSTNIFAIGLGPEELNIDTPFQCGNWYGDEHPGSCRDKMKRALLATISNDQGWLRNPTIGGVPRWPGNLNPQPTVTRPYTWDFPCHPSASTFQTQKRGQSFIASNGNSLVDAFSKILKFRVQTQE